MLKALELIGFKSFATKTRFHFDNGITAVVGPNGSGKSNVVDAIKWVLGEQSVKSLRGKEMADVIFNGSGSRRPVNSAEVTLVFDNSAKIFETVEHTEVEITRRIYRSGEGEYLINRQPSRLKDIRDLLSGTGLGTNSYSIIEQGKVDSLLQSSPKDRRLIFEEAAGISRFRTKKLEAKRRLERVEQNLLRLSDIVDEVEHRLRSLKQQAGKARRYREHVERLQELRTQVGLVDWTRLSERIEKTASEITELTNQRDQAGQEVQHADQHLEQSEQQGRTIDQRLRQLEADAAEQSQQIAEHCLSIRHEQQRSEEYEHEIAEQREHLVALNSRSGDLRQQTYDTRSAIREAESLHADVTQRFLDQQQSLQQMVEQLEQQRTTLGHEQAELDQMQQQAGAVDAEAGRIGSQISAIDTNRERLNKRKQEIEQQIQTHDSQLEQLQTHQNRLRQNANERLEAVNTVKQLLEEHRSEMTECRSALSQLEQRRGALVERADVLQQLQHRHEGLSPGVREVLIRARNEPGCPFGVVHGVVADLLRVSVDSAKLIEIALGQTAQHLVVPPDGRLLRYLEQHSESLPGRVGFVWLDRNPSTAKLPTNIDFEGRKGVLGRADRFVETDPMYVHLARRLLGRTWIVEQLSVAMSLARQGEGLVSFVTLAGEYLAADSTLVVGPQHAASGLISRRSELRVLDRQIEEVDQQLGDARTAMEMAELKIDSTKQQLESLTEEHRGVRQTVEQHGHKVTAASERRNQMGEQLATINLDLETADLQRHEFLLALQREQENRARFETMILQKAEAIETLSQQCQQLDEERQTFAKQLTDTKIELAKSEERLRNLGDQMLQFEETHQERIRAVAQRRQRLELLLARHDASQYAILGSSSRLASLYLEKERLVAEINALQAERSAYEQGRSERAAAVRKHRESIQKLDAKIHKLELDANQLKLERQTMADRLREDYGIEQTELERQAEATELDEEAIQQREAVKQEIDELRRKINNLGNVNLEALEELQSHETRYETLAAQYKDLVDSKAALERIIEKINVDSRRLFLDSFEMIKGHFETLFRNLFGGGQADLVLESEEDVLEGGVDIVARPPGKELRNISLLSGGEKTLTCVALLLAIFQSRPSPFCVLDEVDAALDEANIGRFIGVLESFMDLTQFVIVTHSKKTMNGAATIYGVTMQESGVSKQVSVRFEEVDEQGNINEAA